MQAAHAASTPINRPVKKKRKVKPAAPPEPLLSQEEIARLVASVESAVHKVAKHYSRGCTMTDREDLVSAGRLGALLAARRYDPNNERGALFFTYAYHYIHAYVAMEAIRVWGQGRMRDSSRVRKVFFQLGRAQRTIESRGELPTPERVAEVLGLSETQLNNVTRATQVISYEAPPSGADNTGRGEWRSLAETVADETVVDPLEVLCTLADGRAVYAGLQALNMREQYIIRAHYFDGLTLEEVGQRQNLSRERIRQIIVVALRKVREKAELYLKDN